MLCLLMTLVFLASNAVCTRVAVEPFKQLILDLHNGYRRELGSTNMQYLEWDDTLQAESEDWASRCQFHHKNGQGENLAYNSWNMTDAKHVREALKSWYDEKQDYRYSDLSCSGVCSHYTNLVWAKTTKVGCGLERCSNYLGFYTVCFYKPVGNWIGEYPYLTGGAACSRCNPGQHCDNKLCRGVSTSILSTGTGPHGDCVDDPHKASRCPGWKFSCQSNRQFMETHCPKTCGFCSSNPTTGTGNNTGSVAATSITKTTSTKPCKNSAVYDSRCEGWKWSCHANSFMEHNCPKTCGFCTDGSETVSGSVTGSASTSKVCANKAVYDSRCEGWKWSCQSNRGFMELNCPKACGFCTDGSASGTTGSGGIKATVSTTCIDSVQYASRCLGWKWSCTSNAGFMEKYCKKTCGTCS